jgi:hypothetical protein
MQELATDLQLRIGSGSMSGLIICPVEHLDVSWFISNHLDLLNVIVCEAANLISAW